MKMQGGFIKGAPDIVIAGSPTFLCEMKSKAKTSRIAKEQTSFLERADRAGCFCCVAYGWEAAIEANFLEFTLKNFRILKEVL